MSADLHEHHHAQARRASFLAEMGIKVQWQSRARLAAEEDVAASLMSVDESSQSSASASPNATITVSHDEAGPPKPVAQEAQEAAAPARVVPSTAPTQAALPQSAINKPSTAPSKVDLAWDDDVSHVAPAAQVKANTVAVPVSSEERATAIAQMDWHQLERAVAQCTACSLCRGRTQTVFGVGDKQAQWLLIGEGPGRTEDALGEPFVGKSGKLLDNMLASLQLKRGQNVYIANIVKCRPTDASGNDRPPSEQEAAQCRPFLARQIALLQPKLLLALGRTAAVSLLQVDPQTAVGSLRGRVQQVDVVQQDDQPQHLPVVVTYHPAYLLRKPVDKAKAWADLCLAQQQYER